MDETRTEAVPTRAVIAADPVAVTVLHSPDGDVVGRTVTVGRRLVIGREPQGAHVLGLRDPGLSRTHLQLERRRGSERFGVVDLESKNGTFVDGAAVTRCGASPGTVVRAGGTVLWVGAPPVEVADRGGLGRAPAWADAVRVVDRVAESDLGVLLVGETGTGKEVAAARLHAGSRRRGPLEAVNCAAIPPDLAESLLFGHVAGAFTGAVAARDGHFVLADRGTLFLDELGELPLPVQAKLLRVLETGRIRPVGGGRERRVDVRLVAATCVDLDAAVGEGEFRQDLFARLAGVVVRMPPLRERRLDILDLARHFLAEAGCGLPLDAVFAEGLVRHDWPHNVRGLRTAMRRVALLADGDVLDAAALAVALPEARVDDTPEVVVLLREHRGNVAAIAAAVGKDRKQVYRWLQREGLDPADYR
ncbi:MAG: DNA-binding NtrC family response regulator [Myxococcota bacterium]|jgi:DNA-binding NtrC family response regulator